MTSRVGQYWRDRTGFSLAGSGCTAEFGGCPDAGQGDPERSDGTVSMCLDRDLLYAVAAGVVLGVSCARAGELKMFLRIGLSCIRKYYLTTEVRHGIISTMRTESLVEARRAAEAAVEDMSDGPLKVAAFQTILARLLDQETPFVNAVGARPGTTRKLRAGAVVGSGTTARLVALLEEGFFAQQRSLAQNPGSASRKRLALPVRRFGNAGYSAC